MLRHPLLLTRRGAGLIAACLLLTLGVTSAAHAADNDYCASGTTTYDGPVNGTWGTDSSGTNWSGGLPDDSCQAVIPAGDTVTLTTTPGAEEASTAAGGSAEGLTIDNGATLIVEGVSSQGEQGNISNSTGLQIGQYGLVVAAGATLDLEATDNASPFTGDASGETSGGSVDVYPDGSATASITNQGTINVTSTDSKYTDALNWNGTFANTGTVNVASGALTFQGQNYAMLFDNQGSLNVASGASLTMNAGNGSSFTNTGSYANQGSTILTTQGSLYWAQSGGTVTGNPINLEGGMTLQDSAGAGACTYTNCAGGYLNGTIPSEQTITVVGGCSGTTLTLGTNAGSATVVNDGTLNLQAPTGGSDAILAGGELDNNGTVTSTTSGTLVNQLAVPLVNEGAGSVTVASGSLGQDTGSATTNNGTVTLSPGTTWVVRGGSFTNNATLGIGIAGPSSTGQFSLTLGGVFDAGGTLAPTLSGGYVPAAGSEFPLFLYNGGSVTGTFATVSGGFSADYSKETASPGYVGVIYGTSTPAPGPGTGTGTGSGTGTPTPAPTTTEAPTVSRVSGGGAEIVVKLSCPAGVKACDTYTLTGTVGKRTVASGHGSLVPGKSVTATLKLNATGKRLLKRDGRLKVKVVVTSGGRTLKTVTVTVTKAKAKAKTKTKTKRSAGAARSTAPPGDEGPCRIHPRSVKRSCWVRQGPR